jgi:predicted CoA-binding protein
MPLTSDQLIAAALRSKTIAVVGLSKNPEKASNDVASYLKSHGYRIVPINPTADEVLGDKCYESLHDVPDGLKREIEVLDIFRRPEDVPPIVEEAIQLRKAFPRLTTVWMQLGIVNEEAAEKARQTGLNVVMDRCMKIEHGRRLGRQS